MPFEDDDDQELDDLEDDNGLDFQTRLDSMGKKLRLERKSNKELSKKLAEGEEAQKKLALIDAKLPDTPQVKYFLDHYEGEYDPQSIRAKAAEFGFIEADPGAMDEVNTVESMMAAATGATSTAPGTDQAMLDEIGGVTAIGQAGSAQIAAIMRRYGKFQEDE